MSEDSNPQNFDPEDFAKFLEELINGGGNIDAEDLARIAGLPNDPAVIKSLMETLKQALVQNSGQTVDGVNWKVAGDQALAIARENSPAVTDGMRTAIAEAAKIASLWLDEASDLSALANEPKLLTRELWVQDAMPLFQALAGPIAKRVATALSENMKQNLPEELSNLAAGAEGIMRSAGGALFAMQLGATLGKLSHEVLTGGDIGLPFYAEARAAFAVTNIQEFVSSNELVADQAYIYLAVRELAYARLFRHSRWLRDAIVSQLTSYASGISIDQETLTELAAEITSENANALRDALESGALLSKRTEEQEAALSGIEHLLSLVEGWVDTVTKSATKLLPASPGFQEVMRRRRATSSPAQSTFATLVGLELKPKLAREAAAFWENVTEQLGVASRDALWNHPDLLPTQDEVANPLVFLKKREGPEDELDRALKDLLDE